jgi:hypothetical protein
MEPDLTALGATTFSIVDVFISAFIDCCILLRILYYKS